MIPTYVDCPTIEFDGFVKSPRVRPCIFRAQMNTADLGKRSNAAYMIYAPKKVQYRALRATEWSYQIDTHSESDLNAIHLSTSVPLRLSIEKPGGWYSAGRIATTFIEGDFK